jgi:hypothetical protein
MGRTVTDLILAIVANAAAIVCLFVVGRAIYYPFWARWASHAGHIAHYERLYGALTQAQLELLLGFVRGQVTWENERPPCWSGRSASDRRRTTSPSADRPIEQVTARAHDSPQARSAS